MTDEIDGSNARNFPKSFFHISRDPSLLPVGVRSFIACIGFVIVLIVLYSHADFWNKLSACGLVLGIFGSGILYWETIADERGLRSVSNEIARSSSKKLSFSDTGMAITLVHLGIVQFFIFVPPWFTSLKVGQNGLWTSGGVILTFAVFMGPAISTYLLAKFLCYWCHVWSRIFQIASEVSQIGMTKNFLRVSGFASLFCQGSCRFRQHWFGNDGSRFLNTGASDGMCWLMVPLTFG